MAGRNVANDRTAVVEAMASLDRTRVLELAERLRRNGLQPYEVYELLHRGTEMVNNSYAAGEYFIADLIAADVIFKDVVERLGSSESPELRQNGGRVLLGTVKGDIHDLGKSLIMLLLRQNGFEAEDVGNDIPPERFVSAVLTSAPDILILSGTISGSEIMMARTIEAMEEAGLRDSVRVLLGGNCINEQQAFAIGADGYAARPFDCLRLCRMLTSQEG